MYCFHTDKYCNVYSKHISNIYTRRLLTCSNCVVQFHQSLRTLWRDLLLSAGWNRSSSPDTLPPQRLHSPCRGKTLRPLGNSHLVLEKKCLKMDFTGWKLVSRCVIQFRPVREMYLPTSQNVPLYPWGQEHWKEERFGPFMQEPLFWQGLGLQGEAVNADKNISVWCPVQKDV